MRFSSALVIKIPNLIYSPFENSRHDFFQNKKANKEKKAIGKNLRKNLKSEISLPIWILYFYQTRTKGGEKL